MVLTIIRSVGGGRGTACVRNHGLKPIIAIHIGTTLCFYLPTLIDVVPEVFPLELMNCDVEYMLA